MKGTKWSIGTKHSTFTLLMKAVILCSNTVLVTPRHSVHNQWNIAASKENSIAMKTQLYVSYAEDTIQNRSLTLREQIALEMKGNVFTGHKYDQSRLSDCLLLAVGLKVMVTHNIDTTHQIANGV